MFRDGGQIDKLNYIYKIGYYTAKKKMNYIYMQQYG